MTQIKTTLGFMNTWVIPDSYVRRGADSASCAGRSVSLPKAERKIKVKAH